MLGYLARRLLLAIPVLLGILFVTFALARVLPGDPCRIALGERATDEICDAYIHRHGLDRSIPVQFGNYVADVAGGDLGRSLKFQRPVTTILAERFPTTIELSLAALGFAVLVGVPLGLISGYRHNSRIDVASMVGANAGVSMPVFWLGLMLQYLFAVLLRDTFFRLPPSGILDAGQSARPFFEVYGLSENALFDFISHATIFNALLAGSWEVAWSGIRHLILPAIALGTIPLALIARVTRSSLLDVLGLDYVRTARAKGLGERLVVLRHAARNALLPVVTVIGLSLGSLLGGAILTETTFNLTGIGKTLFEGITGQDYTIVQGVTLVVAVGFVVINLVVDLLYAYLDPRVRLR